jgi:hypothetical protein
MAIDLMQDAAFDQEEAIINPHHHLKVFVSADPAGDLISPSERCQSC